MKITTKGKFTHGVQLSIDLKIPLHWNSSGVQQKICWNLDESNCEKNTRATSVFKRVSCNWNGFSTENAFSTGSEEFSTRQPNYLQNGDKHYHWDDNDRISENRGNSLPNRVIPHLLRTKLATTPTFSRRIASICESTQVPWQYVPSALEHWTEVTLETQCSESTWPYFQWLLGMGTTGPCSFLSPTVKFFNKQLAQREEGLINKDEQTHSSTKQFLLFSNY